MRSPQEPTQQIHIVAHRAGNERQRAASARDRADVIELDVHVHQGSIELRHAKRLWFTQKLWERWYFLPSDTPRVTLEEVLETAGPDATLMIDLKCFTRRAARQVRDELPASHPLIVSTRSWWILSVFPDEGTTQRLRSCGNRSQLLLARLLSRFDPSTGFAIHDRLLTTAKAQKLKDHATYVWAVTSLERGAELRDAGVTGLIVDDLELDWMSLS